MVNPSWYCSPDSTFSYGMFVEMVEGLFTLVISMVIPLLNATPLRPELPGNNLTEEYMMVFKSFLSERVSLKVFNAFLNHLAGTSPEPFSGKYAVYLRVWMRNTRNRLEGSS